MLDSLEELGAKVDLQRNFLRFLAISKDGTLGVSQKIEKLKELSLEAPFLKRRLFELIREYGMSLDVHFCEDLPFEQMIDTLWYMEDVNITCNDNTLKQIRMAKGEIPYVPSEKPIFALETLAKLRFHGYTGATLSFEYLCTECKQIFPIHFYRCPNCQSINTVCIQTSLAPLSHEENLSFL